MLDVRQIGDFLPHRFPFLMVDRILEVEEGQRVVGVKNVTINEDYFQGHFPGNPVMPGVLVVEAMAQVGGILLMTVARAEGLTGQPYFTGMDRVRLRRVVVPGDRLHIEAVLTARRGSTGKVRIVSRVDDAVAAEGNFTFVLYDEDRANRDKADREANDGECAADSPSERCAPAASGAARGSA